MSKILFNPLTFVRYVSTYKTYDGREGTSVEGSGVEEGYPGFGGVHQCSD